MRIALWLPLLSGLIAGNVSAGVIEYSVTTVGPSLYQYNYFISGYSFAANEELDIRFDAGIYNVLSAPTAGTGFAVIPCCQPNNPPGVPGDYRVVAQSNISNLSGTFSIDFTLVNGQQPGSQPFFLTQMDNNGNVLFNVDAGNTVVDPPGTPEPASSVLFAIGMIAGGVTWLWRRRSSQPVFRV